MKNNLMKLRWDAERVAVLIDNISREQGRLLGRMSTMGLEDQLKAMGENLTFDVVSSSEMEGIGLDIDAVRSTVYRRLGLEVSGNYAQSDYVEALVSVMLDAMEHYDMALTKEKLCAWQSSFSSASRLECEDELQEFLEWFNADKPMSPIIRSAIAHYWFLSIHPFEKGNGILAKILGDLFLARGDRSQFRFYSITMGINRDKSTYYEILARCQQGDITEWMEWYLKRLFVAIQDANAAVNAFLSKSIFWMRAAGIPLTDRQMSTLNVFLDGYDAKITSKTWADLNKCSKDTAIRDIQDLVEKGLLVENVPGAKRPSYSILTKTKK